MVNTKTSILSSNMHKLLIGGRLLKKVEVENGACTFARSGVRISIQNWKYCSKRRTVSNVFFHRGVKGQCWKRLEDSNSQCSSKDSIHTSLVKQFYEPLVPVIRWKCQQVTKAATQRESCKQQNINCELIRHTYINKYVCFNIFTKELRQTQNNLIQYK